MLNTDHMRVANLAETMSVSPYHVLASQLPSMDALCSESVSEYRSLFAKEHPDHAWLGLSDDEFLIRLNAVQRSHDSRSLRPSVAGLLMFGYEYEISTVFPDYMLDYRRESKSGTVTKRIVSNDGTWSGCVFDFWSKVSPLLSEAAASLGKTRSISTDLSAAAKEALVNALVHSDYAGRRRIVVIQHEDRIEYANPGELRVRIASAMKGEVSDPRNPQLMKMFALIGACKDEGCGLRFITRAFKKAGTIEPALSQQGDPARTLLTLYMPEGAAGKADVSSESGDSTFMESVLHTAPTVAVEMTVQRPETNAQEHAGFSDQGLSSMRPRMSLFESNQGITTDADYGSGAAVIDHAAAPRGQLGEDEAAVTAAMSKVADPEAKEVLALFRERKRLKRTDVEELLGVGSTKAKAIVAELVASGAIDTEGGGRSTYYKLSH